MSLRVLHTKLASYQKNIVQNVGFDDRSQLRATSIEYIWHSTSIMFFLGKSRGRFCQILLINSYIIVFLLTS